MRLLIVTRESANDRRYGLGQSIGRIAEGLESLGHEVVYFSKVEAQNIEIPSEPFWHKWFRNPLWQHPAMLERIEQAKKAAVFASTFRPTHVWFQDPWLTQGFFESLPPPIRQSVKWGISEHGLGSFAWATAQDGLQLSAENYSKVLAFEAKVLQQAHWVFSPSETALKHLVRDLSLRDCPLHWQALTYGRPELPIHLPKDSNRCFTIGALGRIAPVKNYHLIIDSLRLAEQQSQVSLHLLIGGNGDTQALLDYAEKIGLQSTLECHEFDYVGDFFQQINCYISACEVESFGLANREAVASGIPSIIAAGGASCEVLDGGAWLLPASEENFAQALLQMIESNELRYYWHQQSLNAFKKWRCWQSVTKDYEHALQSA